MQNIFLSEQRLVEKAKYDKKSFELLYRKYFDDLYRFIASKVNSKSDVEDIISEVWIKVLKGIHDFHPKNENSFKSWIFTIAYRQFLDFSKLKANHVISYDDEIICIDSSINEESRNIDLIVWKQAVKLINLLPHSQAESVRLRYISELQNKEIALILGISEKTVASNISRGMKNLKQLLENPSLGAKSVDEEVNMNAVKTIYNR